MKALVAHPGTQHAFRLATELHRLNALLRLHTGIAFPEGSFLDHAVNYLPSEWQRRIANRRIPELPREMVRLQFFRELATVNVIGRVPDEQRLLHWRNEHFQRHIPTADLKKADVVIGFDTSSWILTRRCHEIGTPFVLIQTIGHPDSNKAVRNEIATTFPEWSETNESRPTQVREAEQEEHENAALIIASSSFTRETLVENGVPLGKIRVVSHGVDSERFSNVRTSGRPFRFLFVGLITARKGVPLLLEAWRTLRPDTAELWLVGSASKKIKTLLPELHGVHYLGPVPHVELPRVLQQCDVLVFPSYFEGFGLVILEAMASGLPVITTTATAGPDLLKNGKGGWVIPTGDAGALAASMQSCLEHANELSMQGLSARRIAEQFNWQSYGNSVLSVLEEARETGTARGQRTEDRGQRSEVGGQLSHPARVLLAHPGTQYSRHLAAQLQKRGLLDTFWTCFAFHSASGLARLLERMPSTLQQRVENRKVVAIAADRLRTRPFQELLALTRIRMGADEQKAFRHRNADFQQAIPDSAVQNSDAVVGFDTSSWILVRRAHSLGRRFILDQSIGHSRSFQRVREQLAKKFPEWTDQVAKKSKADLELEVQEQTDADLIVAPSQFVVRTLEQNGVPTMKIRVNPFGVDLNRFTPSSKMPDFTPIRLVFVGALQSRKGLPLLFKAWNEVASSKAAELLIVGSGRIPTTVRGMLPGNVQVQGRVPQRQLPGVLRSCHALVFPSYFEGLAQVQIEAAACGLPVIGTENSGCAEIVRHGETGYVLPAGELEPLIVTLKELIANPEIIATMRERLLQERDNWSWDKYGERWEKLLAEVAGKS
jgi:glycosyltransferase involved in cell wall biosynthesis